MFVLRIFIAASILYFHYVSATSQLESQNVTNWATSQLESQNVTNWAKSRQKRFLVFKTQGVHKFVVSLALPIDLKDKRSWRSLSGAWNLQWQHSLPLTVQHWWNSTYFPAKGRSLGGAGLTTAKQPIDLTAMFLYAMIENYMNNKGMNGRECLQRAICENAQVHYVGGVLDRIFKRLLTPEQSMDEYYHDSYAVGTKGADCYKTYFGCPRGDSVFDKFVYIDDVI